MGTIGTAKQNVDQLNSFLRGELSAVETYELALSHVAPASAVQPQLEYCLQSHRGRVDVLQTAIRQLGGEPATKSGAWGTFVLAIEESAAMLGDKATIAALVQGEDHGLADYTADAAELEFESRRLITATILPQQEATYRTMSGLKRHMI